MHKDQPAPSNHRNFTKRVLDPLTLPTVGVAYFYDLDTKGLAISVGKTGRKSFLLYRRIQGRPERVKIGRYPDVSIEQARKTVAALNADIAQDLNPAESMRARRSEMTLADFFKEYYQPALEEAIDFPVQTIERYTALAEKHGLRLKHYEMRDLHIHDLRRTLGS